MCCDHLVCASCAQPVADGRCAVCRAARERMHPRAVALPASMVAALAVLLALAALLSVHLVR